MCGHMKPLSFRKFGFSMLYDDFRCPVCGEKFAVPLNRQIIAIAASAAACITVLFCQVYLFDPPTRLVRFFLLLASLALCHLASHGIGYGIYRSAFRRAQAESTENYKR